MKGGNFCCHLVTAGEVRWKVVAEESSAIQDINVKCTLKGTVVDPNPANV